MCAERVSQGSGSSDMQRQSDGDGDLTDTTVNLRRKSTALSIIPASKLKKHPTYHGNMTGEEANEALKRRGAPSYLIRFSENRQKHILSMATGENKFEHYGLSEENHQYTLDGTDEIFSSIDALLEYYQDAPIDPTKPNTWLGTPCLRDSGGTRNYYPQPTYRRQSLRQPMQTVKEEPTQSEMMVQSLVETNKDLLRLLEERCNKQDEMLERMSRSACAVL